MSLWRNIVACLFLSIAGCAYAQQLPPPGGGGSTGGGSTQPPIGGASITTTISGKDTWKCPTRNDITGNWSIKEVIHDYDQNAWFVDGVRKTLAPVPLGWSSAPTPMTGSLEKRRTYKFTIQIPVAEHLNSVWVAVKSQATAEMSPDGTRTVDNGQGDPVLEFGPWGHKSSGGIHLRKVAIDENGFGEWTVKVYAYASATSTSGTFIAEVNSSLIRDPRIISLPTNYKKKELSQTETFTMDYMLFGEKDTMVSTGPNSSVKVGVEPTKDIKQLSVTFNKTEKVRNEPESTDALSLKMNYFMASPFGLIRTYYYSDLNNGLHKATEGSEFISLDFTSSFVGAIDPNMWPVNIKAIHDKTSAQVGIRSDYGSAPSVPSTVKRDVVKRDEGTTPPTIALEEGQSSGEYKSTFDWADGISGETSVSIIYKHKADLVKEETMSLAHKPTDEAKGAFQPVVTGWISGDKATVLLQPGYQNELMEINSLLSIAFATFLAANPEVSLPVVMVLACVEAGLSGSLDSTSDFGRVEREFIVKHDSKFWTVTNYAEALTSGNFPTGTTAASIRQYCSWSLDAAPNGIARAQARDIWSENGYSKRGGAEAWTTPTLGLAGNNIERWYKFKYFDSPGPGGTP